MDWARDGHDWPNATASRMIDCRPHRWHVQVAGLGPTVLLLHGAGGASQSWRGVFPILARDHRVVAPDFPGQGFTRMGSRWRSGLDATADDLLAMLRQEGWLPDVIVGHSAGAAVALRMAELMDGTLKGVIGINPALEPFKGITGFLFPFMARMLAMNPLTPLLFTRFSGGPSRVAELLATTGSRIDEEGLRLYGRLIRDSGHVDGTLAMMSQWKLDGLIARMPANAVPCLFLVGERDGTVPPSTARDAAARLPCARVESLGPLGHLAHEEEPDRIARRIAEEVQALVSGPVGAETP